MDQRGVSGSTPSRADGYDVAAARWRGAGRASVACRSSRPARRTRRFSLSTHSRRSASRPWATHRVAGRACPRKGRRHRLPRAPGRTSVRRARPPQRWPRPPRAAPGSPDAAARPRRPAERELPDGQIGRRAHDVTVLPQHLEPPLPSLAEPALHRVEVAKEDIDGRAVDRQPGASVDDRTPLAELGHVAAVAQPTDVVGIERSLRAAVVDARSQSLSGRCVAVARGPPRTTATAPGRPARSVASVATGAGSAGRSIGAA